MSNERSLIRVVCRCDRDAGASVLRMEVARIPEVRGVLLINSVAWAVDHRIDPVNPDEVDYACTLIVSKL